MAAGDPRWKDHPVVFQALQSVRGLGIGGALGLAGGAVLYHLRPWMFPDRRSALLVCTLVGIAFHRVFQWLVDWCIGPYAKYVSVFSKVLTVFAFKRWQLLAPTTADQMIEALMRDFIDAAPGGRLSGLFQRTVVDGAERAGIRVPAPPLDASGTHAEAERAVAARVAVEAEAERDAAAEREAEPASRPPPARRASQ
jgi:hypothetical protein